MNTDLKNYWGGNLENLNISRGKADGEARALYLHVEMVSQLQMISDKKERAQLLTRPNRIVSCHWECPDELTEAGGKRRRCDLIEQVK